MTDEDACIGICTLDPASGCCLGCGRQLAEPDPEPTDPAAPPATDGAKTPADGAAAQHF